MKRRRLRPVSDKRADSRSLRRDVVEQARRRDGFHCRAEHLVPHVRCGGPLDSHEVIPRSAWRAGYLDIDNVITVCRAHHDWVGTFPVRAHALGLHGYSWERDLLPPEREPHVDPRSWWT